MLLEMVGEEVQEGDDSGSSDVEVDIVMIPTTMSTTVTTKPASVYQSSAALNWSSSSEDSSPVDVGTGSGGSQTAGEDGSGEELTIHNVFEVSVEPGGV